LEENFTEKENQHYIPKFYLRYFSFMNNKKQIGIYNQRNDFFIPTAKLKTQANKKYFYGKDGIIEDWLASIESIVAPIFSKMPSEELPKKMSTTQADMLFFLILLDLRNPIRVNQWIRGRELIKERLISKNVANGYSDIVKSMESILTQENAVEMVILNARGVIPYMMDLDYKLMKNVSKIPFIISDYPLVKYNQFLEKRKWNIAGHNGYSNIGLQIFLPINDAYMLVLYDPNVYKVGNRKETVVEIDDEDSINQLNLLQYLNCSETIFFNHKISKFYIEKLKNKAKNYQKANITFSKFYQVKDESGNIKENEEVISIGSTDLKINLNLQKINFHSKSIAIKLDNKAAQMRPKAEQFYIYEQKKKNYR
jgi:hypothetical protein